VDRLAHLDQGLKRSTRVAIIGGGWAGLAAAVELCDSGAEVTVFESARQLGGRARSVKAHGHVLDNGQHILIGAYCETLRLMRAVGVDLEQSLKRLPLEISVPAAGFHLRLPRLPAPINLALGLLGAKGCSVAEKFAAVRFIRFLQACDYRLTADCTVSALLDTQGQRGRLRRHLWEALCLAALNTPPATASAQIFANVLHDSLGGARQATDLLLPATDLDGLFPAAAAAYIGTHGGDVRLGTRVEHIDRALTIAGEPFDRIIVAVAPQHAARLLAAHTETASIAQTLADYCYEPIVTVYAGYPPGLRLPLPMLGIGGAAENGDGDIGQWVFDRGALAGAPGVMAFVLSAAGAWRDVDGEALLAALHGELEAALGRAVPSADWHQVIREQRATFSCRPNLARPPAQTPLAGLWLAGDYVCSSYPATLEGAVRSGTAAARGALEQGDLPV